MSMCAYLIRLKKSQLDSILKDQDYFWKLADQWRDTDHYVDLDKTWQAIHFLYNHKAWGGDAPESWIIFGDDIIPSLDVGYGPAAYLNPSQVVKVNKLLEGISEEELRKRYIPSKLDGAMIYPHIWKRDGEEGWQYIIHFYRQLKTLYQSAAEAGEYVVMLIG